MAARKGTRPPAAGKGRKKGAQNKVTKALKEMILGALDDAGGQEYLKVQAEANPNAFLTLIGKVLPLQVTGADGAAIKIERIERVIVDCASARGGS